MSAPRTGLSLVGSCARVVRVIASAKDVQMVRTRGEADGASGFGSTRVGTARKISAASNPGSRRSGIIIILGGYQQYTTFHEQFGTRKELKSVFARVRKRGVGQVKGQFRH